ncbi:Gar1/Naf1 RNA binding region-domain-containing protein [Scleroderma yunnanense]
MDIQFKEPQIIPQDLLLIQDIVATTLPIAHHPPSDDQLSSDDNDSIASTDHEADSEVEVAADLVPCEEENASAPTDGKIHPDTSSDSDSESSSGDSEVEVTQKGPPRDDASDVECEESGTTGDGGYLYTKNEVVDSDIVIPEISEVGPNDVLEKLGEIMSIVGNVVIVKGLAADNVKTLAERALDAETLLVFEDRTVLGYVYETFGPTSQPLYQIKFNQKYSLDTERVRISREVFHVPQKSKYVFVNQLKKLRGSDASNIHDEEPAEDEVDFSDDEKEAAFKQQRKRRRQQSVASSRQTTPVPSQVHPDRTTDHIFHGSNPYDAHGLYDDDYRISAPSRQAPLPYDDPYAEHPVPETIKQEHGGSPSARSQWSQANDEVRHFEARGRGRDHRGRGQGRERKRSRGRMPRGRSGRFQSGSTARETSDFNEFHPPLVSNMPEDAATGDFTGSTSMYSSSQHGSLPWSYQQIGNLHLSNFQPPVQPHINPRFASAFGITLPGNMGQWSPQQVSQTAPYYMSQPPHDWGTPWPRPSDDSADGDTYSSM